MVKIIIVIPININSCLYCRMREIQYILYNVIKINSDMYENSIQNTTHAQESRVLVHCLVTHTAVSTL